MIAHRLSRTDARRIAVRAQLLDDDRPTDLFDTVRRLTLMQNDATAAVAPSAQLVTWSRLGAEEHTSGELEAALDDLRLIELQGFIRPAEDIALYRADMESWADERPDQRPWQAANRDWVRINDRCRRDILERLREDGPLTSRELPDTCVKPWRSTGWNNYRNVGRMIEFMVARGEIAMAGRNGRDRLWDLASRIYPDDPPVPGDKAARLRDERRLQSLGIARAHTQECPVEPQGVGDAGEPAVIDGVRGEWRVDPAQLGRPFRGRTALLSPLDRLVFDRKRMVELFEFDYALEMYVPEAKRRWGYYALPILHGDRLVGKVDAAADRKAGALRVNAVHRDIEFTKAMNAAVDRELADLAQWLNLQLIATP